MSIVLTVLSNARGRRQKQNRAHWITGHTANGNASKNATVYCLLTCCT